MEFVFFGFRERIKWTRWWRGWWGNALNILGLEPPLAIRHKKIKKTRRRTQNVDSCGVQQRSNCFAVLSLSYPHQGRGERYDGTRSRTGPLRPKNEKKDLKDKAKKRIKIKKIYKGVMLWAADVCSRAAFAQPGPVSSISLGRFFSDGISWVKGFVWTRV